MTPRDLARFLGGDATARGANVPGPGHSAKDRSLSILLLPTAPLGFIVYSHAGDDWRECRDYVARKLGLKPCRRADPAKLPMAGRAERVSDLIAWALIIWREGRPLMSAASAYQFSVQKGVSIQQRGANTAPVKRTALYQAGLRSYGTDRPPMTGAALGRLLL